MAKLSNSGANKDETRGAIKQSLRRKYLSAKKIQVFQRCGSMDVEINV